jgi:cysteine peptidase B
VRLRRLNACACWLLPDAQHDEPVGFGGIEPDDRHFRRRMAQAAELQARNPHATFGATKFADRAPRRQRRPLSLPASAYDAAALETLTKTLVKDSPPSINWQTRGATMAVQDEGECGGNSVAMPMAEMGTSLLFIQGYTRELTPLSSQQIVDCDPSGQCGCDGCMPAQAGYFLMHNTTRGWDSAASYPTTGTSGTCMQSDPSAIPIAKLTQYIAVPAGQQNQLMQLLQRGPIAVGVNAAPWEMYTGGVLNDCPSGSVDDAALLVGYNSTATTPYWILQNQWGTDWGEDGFIYIAMQGDMCNILDMPWTITVVPV